MMRQPTDPNQFFLPLSQRTEREGFFLRIDRMGTDIEAFLWKVHERARQCGTILDAGLKNPDPGQIERAREELGSGFELSLSFFEESLRKWMPRRTPEQIRIMAEAVFSILDDLRRQGKPQGILQNSYIKYMCWLYFKLEPVVSRLGSDEGPMILYFGHIGSYELQILSVLRKAGSDVVLVMTEPGDDYGKLDPGNAFSAPWSFSAGGPVPAGYGAKQLRAKFAGNNAPAAPARPAFPAATASARPGVPTSPASARPGVPTSPASARPAPVNPAPTRSAPTLQPAQANPERERTPVPVMPLSNGNDTGNLKAGGVTLHIRKSAPRPAEPQGQPGMPNRSAPAAQTAVADGNRNYPINVAETPLPLNNSWMKDKDIRSITVPVSSREGGEGFFCNCFMRVEGAPNRSTYQSELFQLSKALNQSGRKWLVLEKELKDPDPAEISEIRRGNYRTVDDAIQDLSRNLMLGYAVGLHPYLVRAFVDLFQPMAEEGMPLNKLTTNAVYVLAWMKRYRKELFADWKPGQIACLIFLGGIGSEREALFFRFLSKLPVDVLLLMPNLNDSCCLKDQRLLCQKHPDSLVLEHFPKGSQPLTMATSAFMAERDLDQIMYTGTGMYRQYQFSRTSAVTLNTTYEEIPIYWNQELKYRPNFSTSEDSAAVPVIFAKVNGVPEKRGLGANREKRLEDYWYFIRGLVTENTIFIRGLPENKGLLYRFNPDFANSAGMFKNGVLLRDQVRKTRNYSLGLLSQDMQEYVFDKIQAMVDQKIMVGTGTNGMEYAILSTVLSMSTDLIRKIQQFDFTRKNPKILVTSTGETQASKEDAILFAFLNQIGFDIVFFVPTGYQCVEQWYTVPIINQHQIGSYVYDLTAPDVTAIPKNFGKELMNIIKKGK